jgi:hypothetical protein
MTQRQISHEKSLPACKAGHAARHILDNRRASAGGGHVVECACGSTRKHPTYEAALAEWKRQHRIRIPRRRPAAATTVVQMDLHLQAARGRR